MAYRMKVSDIFEVGGKTIFTGELQPSSVEQTKGRCRIQVDGTDGGIVEIGGEVQTGKENRDLWTNSVVGITKADVDNKDVWLVSK